MDKKNDVQYVLFGRGKNFYSYLERLSEMLPITYYSDNNADEINRQGKLYNAVGIKATDIPQIKNPYIIISVDSKENIEQIKRQFEEIRIPCCHAQDVLNDFNKKNQFISWPQKIHENRINKFIDIDLEGTTTCNFRCNYCYVWRKKDFQGEIETSKHSIWDIRKGLSKEVLGGRCFINLCARGETLLSKDIVELTFELLDEGHYVSIVTNGTIRKNILRLLEFPIEFQERLFFKISFHYHELIEKKLMDLFWENVREIRNSKCSYTLEITPCDDLVKEIEKVKILFEEKEGNALPHISFARDIQKSSLDVLSEYSVEEYNKIWNQFDSKMFSLKSEWYGKKIDKFCYAGNWTYRVNLVNGSIQNCYRHESIGNIFDEKLNMFPVKTIGYDCKMPYCFNNHAFLAWGCVPEINSYTYLDMRDRERKDGSHWISERMKAAMGTRLEEEHFQYANKWHDYEKLYNRTEKPAIIMFNSPDYKNLGDHAIAVAERKFFETNFDGYDFVEVSCEQYIKENQLIKECVREGDVVAITGGGNFGTLWLWIYDLTMNIISTFKNNKILILPQSLWFEETRFGEIELLRAKQILEKHGQVTLCLRDKKSFENANLLFDERVKKLLVPDMALDLVFENSYDRDGIGICLRNDKEKSAINDEDIIKAANAMGLEVNTISTIFKENVFLDNREKEVNNLLNIIANNKLVITDRLHGMIFCAITNTPCIVFDNSYGKISGVYEWIKELPHIEFCDDTTNLQKKIKSLLDKEYLSENTISSVREKFVDFAKALKEEIK